ncbi:MAG: FlgD immunoglobulin-like domain containing protein, partial [bacterium]
LDYNPNIVEIYGASQQGTLLETWGEPFYNSLPGKFQVVGFSTESLVLKASAKDDTLLLINVRIIKNTVGKTNISIGKAIFYDIQGQLKTEISTESRAVLDIIHNEYPYIDDFGDITFLEDSTYIVNIISYIGDSDNTLDQLDISLKGDENFSYIFEGSDLTIIPDPNWSGVSTLIVTVSDIYKYTDSDTFQVTVLPQEDDPLPFGLISPLDTTLWSGENEIEFFWEESVNVDKNDSITYTFYLGTDSTFQSGILRMYPSLLSEGILIIISLEPGVYYWGIEAQDSRGNKVWCNNNYGIVNVQATDITTPDFNPLKKFEIFQNHPNPFNSQTNIGFQLPKSAVVKIDIRDIKGRYIKTLLHDYMTSGTHSVVWDGKDNNNNSLSSGIYLVSFKADNIIKVRKVVLVK